MSFFPWYWFLAQVVYLLYFLINKMSISYLKKRKKKRKKKEKKEKYCTTFNPAISWEERWWTCKTTSDSVNDLVQLRNNANGETMKSEISTLSLKSVSFGSAHDHDVLFLLGDMQLHA